MQYDLKPGYEAAAAKEQRQLERDMQWHPNFALWPRKIDHVWVWLEHFEQRKKMIHYSGLLIFTWEYRIIPKR